MKYFTRITTILTLAVIGIVSVPVAKAETVLFVSPTRVYLNERHKVEIMNLSNMSDRARHYRVSVEEYTMTEQGVTKLQPDFPYSAKKMIRFYPRDVTIQPGERQAVRVMAKIPADTPDGEYHAHIKFFEDGKVPDDDTNAPGMADGENKSQMRVTMAYSAVMPITVTKGTIDTKIDMQDAKIAWDAQAKMYRIDLTLLRSGNGQGVALFDVVYAPPGSKETTLGNRRTFYIYREIDKRAGKILFSLPEGASGGQVKLRLFQGATEQKPVPVKEVVLAIP